MDKFVVGVGSTPRAPHEHIKLSCVAHPNALRLREREEERKKERRKERQGKVGKAKKGRAGLWRLAGCLGFWLTN